MVDQGKLDPENAFDHPYSNVITRCLGDPTNRSNPDFRSYNLKNDDIFLLCSDGLCGLCHDEEIMQIIEENQNDLVACKDQLIEAALAVGGYDNVTIVLCHIIRKETDEPKANLNNTVFSKPNNHKFRKIVLLLFALALLLGGYLYKTHSYMQSGKLRLIRQIQSLLQKQIPQRSLFNQIDKLKKTCSSTVATYLLNIIS